MSITNLHRSSNTGRLRSACAQATHRFSTMWLPALGLVIACSAGEDRADGTQNGGSSAAAVPGTTNPEASQPEQPGGLIDEPAPTAEPTAPPVATTTPEPVPAGPVGGISGVAWMPNNSPEQVDAARAMPASAALVQLTKEPVAPYPDTAYCNVCIKPESFFATTDAKGLFMLEGVPEGSYVMTVEKGQFRRQREVTVVANQVTTVETEWTTLPSNHAPENGDYIPRVAMVLGVYDQAQFVLGKLGIGMATGGMWAPGTATNRVDVFQGDNALAHPDQIGELKDLVGNLEQLKQYHLVVVPCGPGRGLGPQDVPAWLKEPANLENLRAYVAAGGGLFFTGWAGTYADAVFPAQIEFIKDDMQTPPYGETPPEAYDPATNTWRPELFESLSAASVFVSLKAEPRIVDADLSAWLIGQEALKPADAIEAQMGVPDVHEAITTPNVWGGYMDAQIANINEVTLGLDGDGNPIVDKPRILVDAPTDNGDRAPVGVLYRPAGCGRVMYSSYEISAARSNESTPVERVLMYSLMELSVCEDAEPPVVEQPPPPGKPPVPIPLPK